MKKIKISEDQISRNDGKIIISLPVNNAISGYNTREYKFKKPFVADIDGRLYLLHPINIISSENEEFIFIEAEMPDRTMNYAEMIGWQIKCARKEAGLTCEELADRAHVRAKTVYITESGKANMKIDLICTLAEALNMDVTLTPIE